MAGSIKDLIVRIMVDDAEVEKFQKAGAKAFDFGKALDVAAVGAAAALVGLGVGLYTVGNTFDEISDTIRIGTGATGEALDDLAESAKRVGTQIPVEWEKVGPVIADVNTRLGLTGETLETVSMQFLEAGRVLGEEVDIQTTTGALSAFRIEGEAVVGALDFLFQQSQATGIGMNDLASRIEAAGPITQQLGFTFEETAGMIATMDKAGLDSQDMIGAMQRGLAKMVEPGEQAGDTFRRVVTEIDDYIAAGDEASARAVASELFGTRGAADFVGALASGKINMEDLAATAGLTGDSILAAAAETNDFAEKWTILQNKATAALEPLASSVFDGLADALDQVTPQLEGFTSWMSENPQVLQVIAGIIATLSGTILVLAAGMKVFAIAQAIQTAAQWASNAAWLANPVVWIIIAIIAAIAILVAAGLWLYENWDAVTKFIGEAFENSMAVIQFIGDSIAAWWNDLWAGIAQWFLDTFGPAVEFGAQIFSVAMLGLRVAGDAIATWWNGLWSGIGSFFESVWVGIQNFVRGSWNAIVGFIESGVNNAIGLINGIIRGINNVGGAIGIHLNVIPNVKIPRLATGGITLGPQLAMIGDNPSGREAVIPLDSPSARQLLGGGDGPTDLSDRTIEKLARALAGQKRNKERDGGEV